MVCRATCCCQTSVTGSAARRVHGRVELATRARFCTQARARTHAQLRSSSLPRAPASYGLNLRQALFVFCFQLRASRNQCREASTMESSHELGQQRFVERFWGKSRLHFIGTWKERYEALLDTLAEERAASAKQSKPLPASATLAGCAPQAAADGYRCVLHIDMDCFFASVSLLERPGKCRAKAVAICWRHGARGNAFRVSQRKSQQSTRWEPRTCAS